MNKLVFFSCIADEENNDGISYSLAGQLYQQKMIKALDLDAVYSLNIHNKKGRSLVIRDRVYYFQYPSNIFLRIFYFIAFVFATSKKIGKKTDIILYNLTNRNFFVFIFFKYIRRKRIIILLADYGTPDRSFIDRVFHYYLKRASGLLVLSKHTKIHPHTIVQELLIEDYAADNIPSQGAEGNGKNILFSGTISYNMGIHIAIEAMDYLPNYTLHISGSLFDISLHDLQEKIDNCNGTVVYHGVLARDAYVKLLDQCSVCLNLRDTQNTDHQHNFPSKIGEYLYHGKIVVSSLMYPGFEHLICHTPWSAAGVAESVRNVKQSENTREWLLEKFGLEKFKMNIQQLLSSSNER